MRPILLAIAMPAAMLFAAPAPAPAQNLSNIVGQLLGVQNDPSLARCESIKGRSVTCDIPTTHRVEFVRQVSSSPCTMGKTMTMTAKAVTVSNGCRAEFRLIPLNTGPVTANAAALEKILTDALRTAVRKPDGEYGSLYDVRVFNNRLIENASTSTQQIFNGTGQAIWGGRTYPLEYSARIEAATGKVLNFDYQYNNPNAGGTTNPTAPAWMAGTALDAEARAALAAAIQAEYRKQANVRSVQVVVNDAYREQTVTRSDYRFTGKYGVSINDGNWETYVYEGRVFLPRNTVSELKIGARP